MVLYTGVSANKHTLQVTMRPTADVPWLRLCLDAPSGDQKKQLSKERLRLRASLRVRFFFLSLGKLHKLRDEKLPLYDGDGDVGKKDEPGDRVHPPVEHVCHGDTNVPVTEERWKRVLGVV